MIATKASTPCALERSGHDQLLIVGQELSFRARLDLANGVANSGEQVRVRRARGRRRDARATKRNSPFTESTRPTLVVTLPMSATRSDSVFCDQAWVIKTQNEKRDCLTTRLFDHLNPIVQ